MAAITRVQLLHHPSSPLVKPSTILLRLSHSPSSLSALPQILHEPPLQCSHSESFSSSTGGSGASIVGDLLEYLNESWTQIHATAVAKRLLLAAGFHLLKASHEWDLKPGGRYFFTSNMSCLVAFAVGEK